MSATGALYVNGRDMADFGLTLQQVFAGPWDAPARDPRVVVIPGRAGQIRTSADDIVKPRQLKATGIVKGSTRSALLTNLDYLKHWLSEGIVEMKYSDITTRCAYVRLRTFVTTPKPPQYDSLAAQVDFTLETDQDPFVYDLAPQVVSFGATRTAMPLGAAPSCPRTILSNTTAGSLSNPVLSYRNAAGDVTQSMTFTGTLLTGESLDIDHSLMQITKVSSAGVRTSARGWLTAGSYIILKPSDGDISLGVYPTLEVTVLPSGVAMYPRAW